MLDYRDIDERPFDKIASVGMYEHVGRAQLDTYVGGVRRLLRPGGLFLNHGITRLHAKPPRGPTFIDRYVFPDGELHPVNDIIGALEAGGFEIRDVESLREHYALTLRRWVANLAAEPRRGCRRGRRASASASGGSTCSARRRASRAARSASTRRSQRRRRCARAAAGSLD